MATLKRKSSPLGLKPVHPSDAEVLATLGSVQSTYQKYLRDFDAWMPLLVGASAVYSSDQRVANHIPGVKANVPKKPTYGIRLLGRKRSLAPTGRASKRPRKPKSGYNFYQGNVRAAIGSSVYEQYGYDLSRVQHNQITAKIIGTLWRNLSARQKELFEQMADEDKKRYEQEEATYSARLQSSGTQIRPAAPAAESAAQPGRAKKELEATSGPPASPPEAASSVMLPNSSPLRMGLKWLEGAPPIAFAAASGREVPSSSSSSASSSSTAAPPAVLPSPYSARRNRLSSIGSIGSVSGFFDLAYNDDE